jgi:hypothetical protein
MTPEAAIENKFCRIEHNDELEGFDVYLSFPWAFDESDRNFKMHIGYEEAKELRDALKEALQKEGFK